MSPTGKLVERFAPKVMGHVSSLQQPDVYQPILAGLEGVVDDSDGTGYPAFHGFPLSSFPLAGKTGTASVTGEEPTSWFVAFGPVPDPKYVVMAVDRSGWLRGGCSRPDRAECVRLPGRPSRGTGEVRSAVFQPWRTIPQEMTVSGPGLWPRIEPLLAHVEKPARYIGGELGSIEPSEDPSLTRWLLVYPDTYEIGLPNQGLQILYEILNERQDAVAERAYAPWLDMEAQMRANGVPLFSLESHREAGSFDVIAFNWAAELTATNILNLIDLAGVPVRSADRRAGDPLVLVGGHCAFNPEPMADFVDAFVLGDGEEVVGELCDLISARRAERWSLQQAGSGRGARKRARCLRSVALRVEGVGRSARRRERLGCDSSRASWRSGRWRTWPSGRIREPSSCHSSRSSTTG